MKTLTMTTQPIDRIREHVAALPDDIVGTLTSMKRQMGGRHRLAFTVHVLDGDDAIAYRLEWARRLRASGMFTVEIDERDDGFYVAAYPNKAFWLWRHDQDGSEIPTY